jgi:predicted ATP-dependent endonuclease of OLD family
MLLTHARVTNFKSVEDSGEFSIGSSTCLVGKNEAGKTAILEALYKLNPYGGECTYDLQRNYPRRFLSEYKDRHHGKDAQVLQTRWQLTENEVAVLHKLVGKDALNGREVVITKTYNQRNTYWNIPVDERSVLRHVISSSQLLPAEKEACNASSIKELKSYLRSLGALASPEQKKLLQYLDAAFKRDDAALACIDALELPKFVYFSNYTRMRGQVALEELLKKKTEKRMDEDDRVLLALLDLVGTSAEEVANINQFEALITKLEATSTRISREIFGYWSQNRHLKVQFRLDAGQSGDPAPFNSGRILRTRILNLHHDVSVGFDERSTGFVWFFSFLVLFSEVKKTHGKNIILLLDEPGLSLHAKAQEDLLRYFKEKLEPHHQLIYTTHSPFMVPTDNLLSVRTVEDIVLEEPGELAQIIGTKVKDDVLATDPGTLFPLQGALGYEITQSLFIGKDTLLVESPSDLIYLKVFSDELRKRKRTGLDTRWTICPVGGIDKVAAFMSLFQANRSTTAVLTDVTNGGKKNIEELRRSSLLQQGHVIGADIYTGQTEADIEDIVGRRNYGALVNACYNLSNRQKIESQDNVSSRIVKDVEEHFATLDPETPPFDQFQPALFLLENRQEALRVFPDFESALLRFEQLFEGVNSLLRNEQPARGRERLPVAVSALVAS